MTNHEFLLDTELIHTNDGPPQPRRSIFLECVNYKDCECGGKFILRDNQIIDHINQLQNILERVRDRMDGYVICPKDCGCRDCDTNREIVAAIDAVIGSQGKE